MQATETYTDLPVQPGTAYRTIVGNNPVNFVDPYGLDIGDWLCKGTGGTRAFCIKDDNKNGIPDYYDNIACPKFDNDCDGISDRGDPDDDNDGVPDDEDYAPKNPLFPEFYNPWAPDSPDNPYNPNYIPRVPDIPDDPSEDKPCVK